MRLLSTSILAIAILLLTATPSSTSTITIAQDATLAERAPSIRQSVVKRHGDDEHEASSAGSSIATEHGSHASTSHHSEEEHEASHVVHQHTSIEHSQHEHGHMHGTSHPYDGVPSPSELGLDMIVVPPLPRGAGGHSHGHGGEPAVRQLNETTLLRAKGPDPLSYIEWDFAYGLAGHHGDLVRFANAYPSAGDSWENLMGISGGRYRRLVDESDPETRKAVIEDVKARVKADPDDPGRHRFLMILHIIGCIVGCFIILPAALALRAANSSLAPSVTLLYFITLVGAMLCSMLYKSITPQLYPSNKHSGLGYAIFWISVIALGGDVLTLLKQILSVLRSSSSGNAKRQSLTSVLTGNAPERTESTEYNPLEEERMLSDDGASGAADAEELHVDLPKHHQRQHLETHSPPRSVHFEEDDADRHRSGSWHADVVSPSSTLLNTPRTSMIGDLPLWKFSFDKHNERARSWHRIEEQERKIPSRKPRFHLLRQTLRYSRVTLARSIPIISFAAAYTGLAVYTGSCRGPYQNTCLAHGIKGGIFFWYGLLSFGRYLGAYADLGWAWNKQPSGKKRGDGNGNARRYSAEWVECLVIFIYGATNTWMERFGAAPGDAYTVKQVQHISIAVMFWFAGLMGLILETASLRRLLAFPVILRQSELTRNADDEYARSERPDDIVNGHIAPPSYSFSFNPFPALVVGVTGVAMAAHHQDYEYEVSIHALWGNLLAGFSVLRMCTYFFLWLRPPTSSVMPSRPPTEALASFSLTCGGLVFMLSSEEVSFVAMRNGFGDFMMIMNVTVAVVSLLFCLVAAIMVLKAWAVRREHVRSLRSARPLHHEQHHVSSQQSAFIGGDDDEEERIQDDKRQQMTSSPEQV